MVGQAEDEVIEVRPWSPIARRVTNAYFSELNQRFANPVDVSAAQAADDATLTPPRGHFLITVHHGEPVACGGFFTVGSGVAEIKRLWVAPLARGKGLAFRMLHQLETLAYESGHHFTQLDANETLTEARALYKRAGYSEVPAFNQNPHAHHWFQKNLAPA